MHHDAWKTIRSTNEGPNNLVIRKPNTWLYLPRMDNYHDAKENFPILYHSVSLSFESLYLVQVSFLYMVKLHVILTTVLIYLKCGLFTTNSQKDSFTKMETFLSLSLILYHKPVNVSWYDNKVSWVLKLYPCLL